MPLYFPWVIVALIAAADATWLGVSGRTIAHPGPTLMVIAGIIFSAFLCGMRWPRIAKLLQCLAQNLSLTPLLLIFAYLSATANFPLRDDLFAAADRAIRFDWVALYHLAASSQLVMDSLAVLYVVPYGAQAMFLALVLPFFSIRRNAEFLVMFSIMTVFCCVIAMLLPAKGAIFYFGVEVDPKYYTNVFTSLKTFTALRDGTTRIIDFAQYNGGIVVFPSFHASAAILFTYAVRGAGRLFRVAAITNGLMLLSIPVIGDHYIVDVIGGVILAVVVIVACRALIRAQEQRSLSAARQHGHPALFADP